MRKNDVKLPIAADKIRSSFRLALLALLLMMLAGCAVGGGKLPEPAAESPVSLSVPTEAGVSLLTDGRTGFVIREVPKNLADWEADFAAAVERLNAQDYPEAIELLQQVIEHEPGVTAPYIDLALAYRKVGKPEPAEENLKTALALVPAHPVAGNEYGLLLRSSGRFAEARTIYEQTLAQFPDYSPAHRNLGILCDLYLSDPECALGQYEIYSAAKPDDEQVKLWIADLRIRLGR